MFKIDPMSGLWSLKHSTCGATFQVTGENLRTAQGITCPNCKTGFAEFPFLQKAVEHLDSFQTNIAQVKNWEITPPISKIEGGGNRGLDLDLS